MTAQGKSLLRSTLTLTGICTLLCAAACDSFLVPTCSFYTDRKGCPDTGRPSEDGGSGSGGQPDLSMPKNMPNPVETSFQFASKIPLDSNTKYVGMAQKKAITWNNNSNTPYLKSYILNLDIKDNPPNEVIGAECSNCANLSKPINTRYSTDRIFVTNNNYWRLQYHDTYNLTYFNNSAATIIDKIKLGLSPNPRAFFHPTSDLLVVIVTEAPNIISPEISVIKNGAPPLSIGKSTSAPTAFAAGDLDSADGKNQQDEILLFAGPDLLQVAHINPMSIQNDNQLKDKLAMAIYATRNDGAIDAAFVADLNNDNNNELIYIRKGIANITTYLNDGSFMNWSKPIPLSEIGSDTVISLSAVKITDDNLPELVVETDKAVHFYVNQP